MEKNYIAEDEAEAEDFEEEDIEAIDEDVEEGLVVIMGIEENLEDTHSRMRDQDPHRKRAKLQMTILMMMIPWNVQCA